MAQQLPLALDDTTLLQTATTSLLQVDNYGLDSDLFEDQHQISFCLCVHCNSVCRNASELGCDHDYDQICLYCKDCLQLLIQDSDGKCPINAHPNPSIHSSRAIQRQIAQSLVICPYSSKYKMLKHKQNHDHQQITDTIGDDQKEGMVPNETDLGCRWNGTLKELINTHMVECTKVNNPLLVSQIRVKELSDKYINLEQKHDEIAKKYSTLMMQNKQLMKQNSDHEITAKNSELTQHNETYAQHAIEKLKDELTKTKERQLKVFCALTNSLDSANQTKIMFEKQTIVGFRKEITLLKQQLDEMQAKRIAHEAAERKNDLETYMNSLRAKIYTTGRGQAFIKDSERETLSKYLAAMEDWVYKEGDSANKTQFMERLEQLKDMASPMEYKLWEFEHRGSHVCNLKKLIIKYQQWPENKEAKYEHIGEDKRKECLKYANDADAWLVNQQIKQDRLRKYETPVLKCKDIDNRYRELYEKCNAIVQIPKPKPKTPTPPPKEEEKEKANADTPTPKPNGDATVEKTEETPQTKDEDNDTEMTDKTKVDAAAPAAETTTQEANEKGKDAVDGMEVE